MKGLAPAIFLGDLVRACSAVAADDPDEIESVAALLGIDLPPGWFVPRPAGPIQPESEPDSETTPIVVPIDPAVESPRPRGPTPPTPPPSRPYPPGAPPRTQPAVLPFEIERHPTARVPLAAEELRLEAEDPSGYPPEPLFRKSWTRAILTEALSTDRSLGAIDVPRIIDALARRVEIVFSRCPVPTLARGCQVLVDRGPALEPFRFDRAFLLECFQAVVGRGRVAVVEFDGFPGDGVGLERERQGNSYTPPATGTPVALLSDLGISGAGRGASPRRWQGFAAALRSTGNPLVAFVPYPRTRWPAGLSIQFPVVWWDQWCTVEEVRRARERGGR
jgi:hypothetical protein